MDKTFITKLVADAVKYLGGRIDKISSQRVELDLTSRSIEKLQDVDYRQINALIKEMKSIADGHSKSNTELIDTLRAFEKATKDDTRLVNVITTQGNTQKQMLAALDRIGKQLTEDSEAPEDDSEEKAVLDALARVETAIRETETEKTEFDNSPVVNELASLRKEAAAQSSATVRALESVVAALGQLPKKLEIPKEFKLDNEQLRSIRSGGGGSVISMPSDAKTATRWQVDTVALTLANTEYSYTFPANTVSWTMKLRVQGATMYYSSTTGKLPTSGDGTDYMTMLPLGTRSQDNVEWSGKTMYLQSDTAGQVVELDIFTL